MQKRENICARGYLDVLVGVEIAQMTTCKGRGRGWLAVRARRGSASACNAGAGQGREGLAHLIEIRSRCAA